MKKQQQQQQQQPNRDHAARLGKATDLLFKLVGKMDVKDCGNGSISMMRDVALIRECQEFLLGENRR